jgi:hypothetical protein
MGQMDDGPPGTPLRRAGSQLPRHRYQSHSPLYRPRQLLEGIDRLFAITQEAAYYNIILPLLMYAYNAVLRSQLKQIGVDYTLVDMQQDTPEFQRFNPGYHLEKAQPKISGPGFPLQEQIRLHFPGSAGHAGPERFPRWAGRPDAQVWPPVR